MQTTQTGPLSSSVSEHVDLGNAYVSTETEEAEYNLCHRRFAHLGAEKLRTLHKVTTLEKPIPIAQDKDEEQERKDNPEKGRGACTLFPLTSVVHLNHLGTRTGTSFTMLTTTQGRHGLTH